MRQFVLPPSWSTDRSGGTRCELGGRDARRIAAVLRLGPGDSFPALDPEGRERTCTVVSAAPGRVVLDVGPASDTTSNTMTGPRPDIRASSGGRDAPLPGGGSVPAADPSQDLPRIVLAVALLKGSKLDDVVRAAAESGVAAVVPLVTERSLPADGAASRAGRLSRVLAEALGQSGSRVRTALAAPTTLAGLADAYPPSGAGGGRLCVFFHESPLAQGTIHGYCSPVPREAVACVGPEGGFSDAEVRFLSEKGFRPAWLGPGVLRAETAALFAVASLRIVLLERASWSTTGSSA